MGLPVEVNNLMLGSLGGYTVGRSLRFRNSASAYLNRTPSSAGNRRTWTFSFWAKLANMGTGNRVLSTYTASTDQDRILLGDSLLFATSVGGTQYTVGSNNLFRDPSAWYHFIVSVDTTQATTNNRMRLYVNGNEVSYGTQTMPPQNTQLNINNTISHWISGYNGTSELFGGYLAEVNFIDGQQLTPSSFGAYDTNGVWQPKKYSGTYGTNGFYLPFSANTTSAYATYQSDSSGTYNTLPSGSQGSTFQFPGDFTVEGWVLYTSASSGDGSVYVINDGGSNYFAFNVSMSAGVYNIYCNSGVPTASFSHGIQAGVWTHIALVRSGSTITAYTNGVAKGTITNSATLGYSSIGFNRLGGGVVGIPRYMSNIRVVKSAVYTSAFTPPTSPLTAIANTLFLTYQNSTAIDNGPNAFTLGTAGSPTFSVQYPFAVSIANDASGNGNNWTPNNISLINGTTYDSMIDSPTNSASSSNYAVLNPLNKGSVITVLDGNLGLTATATWNGVTGTIGVSSGKWYWELVYGGGAACVVGVVTSAFDVSTEPGIAATGWRYRDNGAKRNGPAVESAYGATWTTNDNIGIALDMDAGTITFYKNGVSQGVAFSNISGNTVFPAVGVYSSTGTTSMNFGQRPFTYTPPSGFKALNTYNLPAPSISNGAQYMAATTYTGTGSALSVSNAVNGVGFQPDFVWMKKRSAASSHYLQDSVRGSGVVFYSDQSAAENAIANSITSFNSSGFSLGTNADVNGSGASQVAWNWKKSATAGFDVITYTGNGSSVSAAHSLGVAPDMVIIKSRSNAQNWVVYHKSLGTSYYVQLNTTSGQINYGGFINPLSSQIYFGGLSDINTNGATYVAYCFSAVSGYSAFGKYTGNGSADGPFVFTNFRPRWLLVKRTDAAEAWLLVDSSRNTYNVMNSFLQPQSSVAEQTANVIDFLSNGFKVRDSGTGYNASGGTYIYMAFAENPFNSSRAR